MAVMHKAVCYCAALPRKTALSVAPWPRPSVCQSVLSRASNFLEAENP